jgi:hypothetical protein
MESKIQGPGLIDCAQKEAFSTMYFGLLVHLRRSSIFNQPGSLYELCGTQTAQTYQWHEYESQSCKYFYLTLVNYIDGVTLIVSYLSF